MPWIVTGGYNFQIGYAAKALYFWTINTLPLILVFHSLSLLATVLHIYLPILTAKCDTWKGYIFWNTRTVNKQVKNLMPKFILSILQIIMLIWKSAKKPQVLLSSSILQYITCQVNIPLHWSPSERNFSTTLVNRWLEDLQLVGMLLQLGHGD